MLPSRDSTGRWRKSALMSLAQTVGELLVEPLFLLLFAAGVVYLLIGESTDAAVLLASAAVAAGIYVVQCYRTDRVLDRLRELSAPRAMVLRNGDPVRVATAELVSGDCMILSEGDRVAADALLIECDGLCVDESLLTGESAAVMKTPMSTANSMSYADMAPHEARNHCVYAGTMVVAGHGLATITALGRHTEFGRISAAVADIDSGDTPLRRDTARLATRFGAMAIVLCLVLMLILGFQQRDWYAAVLAGLTLAMAILPQEFPLVITVFLALAAWRIAQAGVLARRNDAIEALGAVNVLCVDKTGTLTENRMQLTAMTDIQGTVLFPLPDQSAMREGLAHIIAMGAAASNPQAVDPMDRACLQALSLLPPEGRTPLHTGMLLKRYPMQSGFAAVGYVWKTWESENACLLAVKGAPETVLAKCDLPATERSQWLRRIDTLANSGLRVLALASARLSNNSKLPAHLRDVRLEMVALLGFQDPLRREVPYALNECRRAGIRVIMITGDYPGTARQIARDAGLVELTDSPVVMNGNELEQLDEAELQRMLGEVHAVARVAPLQKLRIVNALLSTHVVVGMTGDGVNDAPALKAATIGIAMGKRGSDVAREAAGMVLVNDDFASIVIAIRAGRRMFENLRHALQYVVAVHVPIIGLAALPLIPGLPSILMPVHVMFFEFVIDPACSVVFEAEPAAHDLMEQAPRRLDESVLSWPNMLHAVIDGSIALAGVLASLTLLRAIDTDDTELRAAIFAVMVCTNLALIFAQRGHYALGRANKKAHSRGPQNWALWIVTTVALTAMGVALTLPSAREIFHFAPLSTSALAISIAMIGLTIVMLITKHRLFRRAVKAE